MEQSIEEFSSNVLDGYIESFLFDQELNNNSLVDSINITMEEAERLLEIIKFLLVKGDPFPELSSVKEVKPPQPKLLQPVVRLERLDLRKLNLKWLVPVIQLEKIKN